jgi:hypothetical protein
MSTLQKLHHTMIIPNEDWGAGVGGVAVNWNVISANHTASINENLRVNLISGPITISLPVSPTDNSYVRIQDYLGTIDETLNKNITINPNGKTITDGLTEIDVKYADVLLTFIQANDLWTLVGSTYV